MATAIKEAKKAAFRQHLGVFKLEFADAKASVDIPTKIHLIPIGEWGHDMYGPITIGMQDIREFVQNFNAGIRKGVPITAGHEGFEEYPAVGWITSVEAQQDGLWGDVEWNNLGTTTLSDKQYKFFSPEFFRDYEDPQTHDIFRNVLTGGALTKSPYFKELEAVVFSDKNLLKFNENQDMSLILADVLAKDITTLTDEEKGFVKEHKAELTPEQLTSHAELVAEAPATDPAPVVTDPAPVADPVVPAVDPVEVPPADTQVNASEKVMISASELSILRTKANEGAQAFAELKKVKLDSAVATLSFSETNKAGKFLPKTEKNLRAFMETLNETQMQAFSAIVSEIPTAQVFGEVGDGGAAADTTTVAQVEHLVEMKMSEAEKAGKPMRYADALKEVMASTSGLEETYDRSLTPTK